LSIAWVVAPPPRALYCGMKSSVDEIRRRFDADVERFSNGCFAAFGAVKRTSPQSSR
jgi:hypothetical protein